MDRGGSWASEAAAVIKDIDKHVKVIKLSPKSTNNSERVYFNLTTMEDEKFCVELSSSGFRIVGRAHDRHDDPADQYFETPYSLLSAISPLYNDSFGQELMEKLSKLADK